MTDTFDLLKAFDRSEVSSMRLSVRRGQSRNRPITWA